MTAGCHDPAEAIRRSMDLVGAAVANTGEMQWWVEKSASALGAGMHAAGLVNDNVSEAERERRARPPGRPPRRSPGRCAERRSWARIWATCTRGRTRRPGRSWCRRRYGTSGRRKLFHALTELDKPGKTADSIRITMSKSLMWLAIPELAAMVTGRAPPSSTCRTS
jgi:hypothetical protein